jgi:hypothetical protein
MNSSRSPIPGCNSSAPLRRCGIWKRFQYELGRIEADLRAVRAFADAQIDCHWRHALAGTLKGDALPAQATQTATWITQACVRIVDECFRLGGGSALYESSPLQRRMRDIHAAAQHAARASAKLRKFGQAIAGQYLCSLRRPRSLNVLVADTARPAGREGTALTTASLHGPCDDQA